MKRSIASIACAFLLLSITSPALARSFNDTRWNQSRNPRLIRSVAKNQRHKNLAYRRSRYNEIVTRIMSGTPSTLAVTGAGGRNHVDHLIVNRLSARSIKATQRLSDRCDVGGRVSYNDGRAVSRCTQVDE